MDQVGYETNPIKLGAAFVRPKSQIFGHFHYSKNTGVYHYLFFSFRGIIGRWALVHPHPLTTFRP